MSKQTQLMLQCRFQGSATIYSSSLLDTAIARGTSRVYMNLKRSNEFFNANFDQLHILNEWSAQTDFKIEQCVEIQPKLCLTAAEGHCAKARGVYVEWASFSLTTRVTIIG